MLGPESFERVEQLLINMLQFMEQIQATTHEYLSNQNKLWYKSLSKMFQNWFWLMKMEFGQQIDILWGIEIHFKNVPFEIMIIFLFVDKTYFLFARITLEPV